MSHITWRRQAARSLERPPSWPCGSGCACVEEIARLVGHSGTDVTEKVYQPELRPLIQTGAQVMDDMFADVATDVGWSMVPLFSVTVARGSTHT